MARNSDQVLGEVNAIVADILHKDTLQLTRGTVAHEVEDWDSLNHIEIVVAVEKHFNIRFNFAELQKFKNVGEMCDNIVRRLNQDSL